MTENKRQIIAQSKDRKELLRASIELARAGTADSFELLLSALQSERKLPVIG